MSHVSCVQVIYNISVEHNGRRLRYEDLCARYNGLCYDNEILAMSDLIPDVEVGNINLTYPVFFDPFTFQVRLISVIKS